MKRTILICILLSMILLSSITAIAESPAHLVTTISGGFGLTVKVENVGNMTASNISYNCIIISTLTNRNKVIEKKLNDIVPNEELIIHHLFFFIGKVMVGASPLSYFNGEEFKYFITPIQYAFAIGPFVKLLGYP